MAKLFEKVKNMMFGENDYEDGYEDGYEDDYEDEYETVAPAKKEPVYGALRDVSHVSREPEYTPGVRRTAAKNGTQVSSITASVQMQVVIIKPECYEDAQEICDQIKTNYAHHHAAGKAQQQTDRAIGIFLQQCTD